MSSNETERLFFALWPNDEVRKHLARLNREMPVSSGKPVKPDNLHITLQFIGSVSADKKQCLLDNLQVPPIPPFSLSLDRLGYWARPRVLWIGCEQAPLGLLQLVAHLGTLMKQCDLPVDPRPYHVHLTLRRKVKQQVLAPPEDSILWPVDAFVLVKSETLPEGVHYSVLHQWPFAGAPS